MKELKEMQTKLNLTDEEVRQLGKKKHNEYLKQWRAKNRERIKRNQAKCYQKKALKELLAKKEAD